MNEGLKLTAEQVADFHARIKSIGVETIEKLAKAKDANGSFDVIISTEDTDRSGEIVKQNGWELKNYENNPIVLWGHDYYSLPIGVCTDLYKTEIDGVPALGARGVFYPAEINPFAQQVRKMYDFGQKLGVGTGATTSVGFIPKEFDENARNTITKAELLEFSFVPIPANQGVGPAQGRALTFEEAKELSLDIPTLKTKGLEFAEVEKSEEKNAQAGDECEMDDGTPGVLAEGADGLVCQPKEEKSLETKPLQKKLLTAIADEHTRHTGEVEKAIDAFADSDEKAEALKDLRDALRDETTLHRARSVDSFRGFNPVEDKNFNGKPHLKALRQAHDEYETGISKLLDDFEGKSVKATGEEADELVDGLTAKFDESQRAHKKTVLKLAKTMCKAAFGEDEPADEEVVEILKEFLTPHLDPQIAKSVINKLGAKLSAATREKLGEAHEHMKAASVIVKALHGGLGDDDGEDGRSGGDDKTSPVPAPRRQRSTPSEAPQNELNDFLFAKGLVKELTTVAQTGLAKLNQRAKK